MKKIKKLRAHLAGKGLSQAEVTYRMIRVLLLQEGLTQADIGRKLGISIQAVNYVVTGDRRTARTREAIAEFLDVDYGELWGEEKKKGAA